MGLLYTTASNAGFITGMYMIFVPIFGLMLGMATGLITWGGCLIAALGLYPSGSMTGTKSLRRLAAVGRRFNLGVADTGY